MFCELRKILTKGFKMIVNMNKRVKVVLTNYGQEIYKKFKEELNQKVTSVPKEMEMTLWEVGSIFGSTFYNGNPKVAFVDNEIEFI